MRMRGQDFPLTDSGGCFCIACLLAVASIYINSQLKGGYKPWGDLAE